MTTGSRRATQVRKSHAIGGRGSEDISKEWQDIQRTGLEESKLYWNEQDEEGTPAKAYFLVGSATLKAQFKNARVDLTNFGWA